VSQATTAAGRCERGRRTEAVGHVDPDRPVPGSGPADPAHHHPAGSDADGCLPVRQRLYGAVQSAGVSPDTIDLNVERNVLTVKAQRNPEFGEHGDVQIAQRSCRVFSRHSFSASPSTPNHHRPLRRPTPGRHRRHTDPAAPAAAAKEDLRCSTTSPSTTSPISSARPDPISRSSSARPADRLTNSPAVWPTWPRCWSHTPATAARTRPGARDRRWRPWQTSDASCPELTALCPAIENTTTAGRDY
jgi:hypothetical protein